MLYRNISPWTSGKVILLIATVLLGVGCKKFIEAKSPDFSISSDNIYTTDATAASVLTGIYANMSNGNNQAAVGIYSGPTSLSLYLGLSADELTLFDVNNAGLGLYYTNSLTASNVPNSFWNVFYPIIYVANSAIDGLGKSTSLTPAVKGQLLGEARFVRAFCYFYLVNMYGDVPLVTTTDYKVNSDVPRTPKAQVWQQIITDLTQARNQLSSDYLDASVKNVSVDRVRPTSWAATALLARVYLYTQKWDSAEAMATNVINNSAMFTLDTLNGVFLKNSQEAIWQLMPTGTGIQSNTGEGGIFILPPSGPAVGSFPVYLSNNVVSAFDSGDQRLTQWTGNVVVDTTTYYYPFKYKVGFVDAPTTEYIMVLRLAEQFLIRAEARARQNNIAGSQSDLDTIRTRAGLPNTSASDQASLINAIFHERQVELFTEWGHRWFDLQRSGMIDAVMSTVTPEKGGSWQSYKALFPVPQNEILADPNLKQTPGYNP